MEIILINLFAMMFMLHKTPLTDVKSIMVCSLVITCYLWTFWHTRYSDMFLQDKQLPLKEREYLFESEIASYGRLPISIVRYSAKIICISLIWICYILSILIFATMGLVIIAILIVSFRFGRIPVVVKDISSALKTYYKESVAGSSSILNDK